MAQLAGNRGALLCQQLRSPGRKRNLRIATCANRAVLAFAASWRQSEGGRRQPMGYGLAKAGIS